MTEAIEVLIKKLQMASSSESRIKIALQLATLDGDKAHNELYRMADGGSRDWKRLWLARQYCLEDQLIALEALAETGTERALNFLHNLYKEDIDSPAERWGAEWTYVAHGTTAGGQPQFEYVTYPNAKGALKLALDYQFDVFDSEGNTTYNGSVHDRVRRAIRRIEETYRQKQKGNR